MSAPSPDDFLRLVSHLFKLRDLTAHSGERLVSKRERLQDQFHGFIMDGDQHSARERMEPIVDHVQITVKDMAIAVPFYDRLMPVLGFSPEERVNTVVDGHLHVCSYTHPKLNFCISSPREQFAGEDIHRRKPGALHHLAFKAPSRKEVDRVHRELVAIGATIVAEPQSYPEYTPWYYAVFFKDLEGIKYEVVCNNPDT